MFSSVCGDDEDDFPPPPKNELKLEDGFPPPPKNELKLEDGNNYFLKREDETKNDDEPPPSTTAPLFFHSDKEPPPPPIPEDLMAGLKIGKEIVIVNPPKEAPPFDCLSHVISFMGRTYDLLNVLSTSSLVKNHFERLIPGACSHFVFRLKKSMSTIIGEKPYVFNLRIDNSLRKKQLIFQKFDHFTNLRNLQLTKCAIDTSVFVYTPQLRRLELIGYKEITGNGWSNLELLEELTINYYESFDHSSYVMAFQYYGRNSRVLKIDRDILGHLDNLKKLCLVNLDRVGELFHKEVPNLKVLQLCRCDDMTGEQINKVPNVEILSIEFCVGIHGMITANLSQLSEEEQLRKVTNSKFFCAVTALKKLKFLKMLGCHKRYVYKKEVLWTIEEKGILEKELTKRYPDLRLEFEYRNLIHNWEQNSRKYIPSTLPDV